MRIVAWIKGDRGVACLRSLHECGHDIVLVVGQPNQQGQAEESGLNVSRSFGLPVACPENPNEDRFAQLLQSYEPDVFVLVGYGKILDHKLIAIPRKMCLNLHAGALPKYRGSSPLNWAIINGETSFTLSIIKVDTGVDTGEILIDSTFPIAINDTIRDLHKTANDKFPQMLLEVLNSLQKGELKSKPQNDSKSSYYPLRFPDDGLIIWDTLTADQIHNRIRALTEPYPCAFTYHNGRRIRLLGSRLQQPDFLGEPGRVYRKKDKELLVCACDKCLWITNAILDDTGEPIFDIIDRYQELATVRRAVQKLEEGAGLLCS